MAANSTHRTVQSIIDSSSDDDLFIPVNIPYDSSDEEPNTSPLKQCEIELPKQEFVDGDSGGDEISVDEKPDSSEDLSSHCSSQENHEEGSEDQSNREIYASYATEVADTKKRQKKSRKKAKKSKGSKPKSKMVDPEMALLDQTIAENAERESKRAINTRNEPKIAPKNNVAVQALRQKLKSKRETRSSDVARVLDRYNSQPASVKEKLKSRFKERMATYTNKQPQQISVSDLAPKSQEERDRTEMLLSKYEDYVADGRMSFEQAIDLACMGRDITEPETLGDSDAKIFMSAEDKQKQMHHYYRAIAQMDPASKTRMKSNIPSVIAAISNEFVDHSVECDGYIDMMKTIIKVERSINDGIEYEESLNYKNWESMSRLIYEKFHDKMHLRNIPQTDDPIKYYEEVLKYWIIELTYQDLKRLIVSGVFDRYDPVKQPLVLVCFQKHAADIFPNTQLVLDMKKVVEAGFAPKDVFSYNPFTPEHKIVAYALFWSFSCSFNLFIAFFKTPDGGYAYYWKPFDRLNGDIDEILRYPRALYNESVQKDDSSTTCTLNREFVKVDTGLADDLDSCVAVDEEAFQNRDFVNSMAAETAKMMAAPLDRPETLFDETTLPQVKSNHDIE